MKRIFNVPSGSNTLNVGLLMFRIGIGLLMLVHGWSKMVSLFSGDPVQFPAVMGMRPYLSLALAVFAEVGCSVLLLAGLGTRLAVLPLIVTMLVAVLLIHGDDPFAKKEPALHFPLSYLLLLVTGSGRYSVDYLLHRRLARRPVEQESNNFAPAGC